MYERKFLKLKLEVETVVIGERIKGGVFRPCQETIPSSTIEGALLNCLGVNVHAVGYFEKDTYKIGEYTYALGDRALGTIRMPFTTQCLLPCNGKFIVAFIFIPYEEIKDDIKCFERACLYIGAFKSKGFGKARITNIFEKEYSEAKQGILKVKIFEDEAEIFGVKKIIAANYGYLFSPDGFYIGGKYKKALFPGSIVEGPEFLLEEETYYDEGY